MRIVQNIFVTFFALTKLILVNFPEQKESLIDLSERRAINVLNKYFLNHLPHIHKEWIYLHKIEIGKDYCLKLVYY